MRSFAGWRVPLSRAEAVAAAVAAANELAAGGAATTGAMHGGGFGLDTGVGGFLSCVSWCTRHSVLCRATVTQPVLTPPRRRTPATRSSSAAARQTRQSCGAALLLRKCPRLARAAEREIDLTRSHSSPRLLRSYAHSHGRLARFAGAFRDIVEGGASPSVALAALLQPLQGAAPLSSGGGAVDAALLLFRQPALGRVFRGVPQVAAADALPVQWGSASALPAGLGVQAQQQLLRGLLSPDQGPRELASLRAGGRTEGPGDASLSDGDPAVDASTNSASFAGA